MDEDQEQGIWYQVLPAVIISLSSWVWGFSIGWTSLVSPTLQKPDNDLGIEPLSDSDLSWILSLQQLSSAVMFPFGVFLCERLGRKPTAVIAACVYLTSWLLKFFATSFDFLLVGQIVTGFGEALALIMMPLYVIEIASNSIRGRLGSLLMFSIKTGYLMASISSALLSYRIITSLPIFMLAVHLLGMLFVPETPVYLVRKNRINAARRSLMKLRANNAIAVELELSQLQNFHTKIMQSKASIGIKELFTDPINLKGLRLGMILLLIQLCSGISVMMLYILLIFEKAGINIDPHIATMIFASCHVIACCGTAVAVDWIGRRPLLLLSTLGMALSYFGLSVFLIMSHLGFDETQFSWLPIAAMALLALSYSIGLGPLSAIMANEFFNPELASLCNCIYIMLSCVGSFLFVKLFAVFSEAVGFHYSFLGFMVACIIGFFIILFIIPETKGRSIESIRNGLGSVQEDFSKSVELPVGYIPKLE